jgi:prepilin-type N-terminal cleavage/methylation domain-containing protein/prepilin-type processing-associated H-X9-DG protein
MAAGIERVTRIWWGKTNGYVPVDKVGTIFAEKQKGSGIMDRRKGFTLIELLVVISIIALLMAILLPVLNKAKERGRRAVCLNNLHQLTLAWILYADENNGKLVNGITGAPGYEDVPEDEDGWIHWFTPEEEDQEQTDGFYPIEAQKRVIREGALFPYCKDLRLYRCPAGIKDNLWTYGISDVMNGGSYNTDYPEGIVKMYLQIPRPVERLVFVDEGKTTYRGYAVYHEEPRWYDPPSIRHSKGATFSFADGHSEYWHWKDPQTITMGELGEQDQPLSKVQQPGADQNRDLVKLQKAAWGRLGYDPKVAPW